MSTQRHHSLAFAQMPGSSAVLNHFMLEVDDLDTVGRALDKVKRTEHGARLQLGKTATTT